jgi:GNAT superfamily N-acetyltransferase
VDNAIFAFVGVLRSLILYFVTAALYLSQVCDKVVDVASKREKNVLKLEKHIKLKDYTQRQASLIFDDKNSRPSNVQKNSVKSVSGRLDSSTSINMRIAEKKDTDLILSFIKELAAYEEMESSVIATSSIIQESLFPEGTPSKAEVIILELDEVPIGFALYFYNFSTFLGKYGLYIEDLYVRKEFRGKGYGKGLIENVCQRALLKDCGRVEWWCLDWNKKAIDFYLNLGTEATYKYIYINIYICIRVYMCIYIYSGAEAMVDWTVYRLSEKQIREIATPK